MAETYAPCMKTCGMTAHGCTMQPGTVAATCTHDFATCMLRCESMVMPEPVKCVSDCTMVAVDEMTSGMDMDMMMLHLKDCVKNH